MMVQRCKYVCLAALSSALVLHSGGVIATTNNDSSTDCISAFIADGDCDYVNNIDICGFDGGDCCECTCIDTETYTCGDYGGFACLDPSASCVNDDDVTFFPAYDDEYADLVSSAGVSCYSDWLSDGDCDLRNNNKGCGYDGGDCCECTCVSTYNFTCGDSSHGGYTCIDPGALCVKDYNATTLPGSQSASSEREYTASSSCVSDFLADGHCDVGANNEECGYDGGDCCECTCVSTSEYSCGDHDGYDCIDPSSSCINGYVQAATKTTIYVSANAYDTRPGQDYNMVGCAQHGCEPKLTRDGVSADTESRWSCAQSIVPNGGLCKIMFKFEIPQDIMEVQVAFWKGDARSRTLEASINGEVIGFFDSYAGPTFNAFSIQGVGVETMTLTSVNLTEDEWISLLEVRFLVKP